jgi:hypothetical protein
VVVTNTNDAGSDSSASAPSPVVTAAPAPPVEPTPPADGHGDGDGQTDNDHFSGGGSTPGAGGQTIGAISADLNLASLGWSRLNTQGCQSTRGARVLVFHVPGAGRFRIRVAPNGTISQRGPLRARALVNARGARILQRSLRHVVYSLGHRRLSTRGRAPYELTISPALLARHARQTLVVRVVPKRGKVRVAKVNLSTTACPDLFSVIHRPSPRGSLLGLRVDTRKAVQSVTFRVPHKLLAARSARGWAGAIRLGVSGRTPMNFRLAFPEQPSPRMTLLAPAGAPKVTVGPRSVTVTGLPEGTGIVQLKLRGRPMAATPRAVLRAVLRTAAGSHRLTQRFGQKLP